MAACLCGGPPWQVTADPSSCSPAALIPGTTDLLKAADHGGPIGASRANSLPEGGVSGVEPPPTLRGVLCGREKVAIRCLAGANVLTAFAPQGLGLAHPLVSRPCEYEGEAAARLLHLEFLAAATLYETLITLEQALENEDADVHHVRLVFSRWHKGDCQ